MKKALSIFLALLMLSAIFVLPANAAVINNDLYPSSCTCPDHDRSGAACHCCLDCENLDLRYALCAEFSVDSEGKRTYTLCCTNCTGIYPCTCACSCCALSDEDKAELEDGNNAIFTPEQQETIIEGFQRILRQISDFFDKLFDAIFEFLRFDEIMGA